MATDSSSSTVHHATSQHAAPPPPPKAPPARSASASPAASRASGSSRAAAAPASDQAHLTREGEEAGSQGASTLLAGLTGNVFSGHAAASAASPPAVPQVSRHTYHKDGATVTDTVTHAPNGQVTTVSDVRRGSQEERTTSVTSTSSSNLEQAVDPAAAQRLDAKGVAGGPRDPLQVTHTTQTDINHATHPPRSTTVYDATTYKQHIPAQDGNPPDGFASVDAQRSGQTLAVTRATTVDASGHTHQTEDVGSSSVAVGTGRLGQPVQATQVSAAHYQDGRLVQTVETGDARGIPKEFLDYSDLNNKSDFESRIRSTPGSYTNLRQSTVTNYDAQGKAHTVKTQQFGSYDQPNADGGTVTITQRDGKTYWDYRKVSDNGSHIQEQQDLEGSDGYILTDTQKHPEGGYVSTTRVVDGSGAVVGYSQNERVKVDPSQVKFGDPKYKAEFLHAAHGRPIWLTRSVGVDTSHPNYSNDVNVSRYSIAGSNETFTTVFHSDQSGEHHVSILRDPNGGTPTRVKNDDTGAEYAMNRQGEIMVNGQVLRDSKGAALKVSDTEGVNGFDAGRQGAGSLDQLYNGLQKASKDLSELPAQVKGPLAGLNVVGDAVNLVNAIGDGKVSDAVNSGGQLAGGLSGLSDVASNLLDEGKLSNVLGVGGDVLGGAGALVGAGIGAYEIGQGKTVDGALDLAAAGGVGAAIIGTAWVPVAGWVVAGGAIIAKIAYDIFSSDDAAHHTHDLQF